MALTIARSREATSRTRQHRLQAQLDRAHTEIALLKEELGIKDSRWSRLPSRKRPHYTPIQRMQILQLRAARGWPYEQAAQAFLVDEQTLRSLSLAVRRVRHSPKYIITDKGRQFGCHLPVVELRKAA